MGRQAKTSVDDRIEKHFCNNSIRAVADKFCEDFSQGAQQIMDFCNVKVCEVNPPEIMTNNKFRITEAKRTEIVEIMKKFESKSPGYDGSPAITQLINASLGSGLLANTFKTSVGRPIYVSGSPNDYSNYN